MASATKRIYIYDIKTSILPPPEAIAQILESRLDELVRADLVSPPDHRTPAKMIKVAKLCQGFSAKIVRRLPCLAIKQYIHHETLGDFLASLWKRAEMQKLFYRLRLKRLNRLNTA